ncbi:class I SAM-dependent DNA methyltransferase [Glycocaulis sp.]|uniref:class I SAM-dependent DNA methyltransferase n=1 Tax=Glycocaulis sp. TaxID=1969725 RepID=UPI003F6FFFB5
MSVIDEQVEAFIERWKESGGGELANTHTFLNELCDLIGVDRPDPSREETALNDYVFERQVTRLHEDGSQSSRRIDLYKRSCFVLEAKQGSSGTGNRKASAAQVDMFGAEAGKARSGTARRGTDGWITAMQRARGQAERYAKDLPREHGWPPFLIVADIGYCFELYADFSGQGKAYEQFPDRRGFRILLEDLRKPEIRARLKAVWTDPHSIDPAKKTAEVTKDIAARLAIVARELEKKHEAEQVALFLMRCLFTMFAEDVSLLPKDSFTKLLADLKGDPSKAHIALEALWREMNTGADLSGWLREPIRRFNGGLFKDARALPLSPEMLSELYIAARQDWTQVEPAIFGTLLEQALDKRERHRLGAHYTPRAYVDRLITPSLMEPLRDDWAAVRAEVQGFLDADRKEKALERLRAFHATLCDIRVLDPACGTGNFLYVAMERMKRLEGEVVDMIVELGSTAALEFEGHTVDPHQFLGLEINPRAAAIAELVLWIGFIQWQIKTAGQDIVRDPVLRDFHNIECRDALLDHGEPVLRTGDDGKPVTRWDGISFKDHPVTGERVPDEAARVEILDYPKAKATSWPKAEFIIGNPPFIGGKDLRASLGDGYTEALWRAYPHMPRSADFVMYWWGKAADLTAKAAKAKAKTPRRFGFITTNSLRQTFNRRVVEAALSGKPPLSIVYAIPDHPWMKSADKAAVRIAMTVVTPGEERDGVLADVVSEAGLNTDAPQVELRARTGLVIRDNLRAGLALSSCFPLNSNRGIGFKGVMPYSKGFWVDHTFRNKSSLSEIERQKILPYVNGRDLVQRSRGIFAIDLYGFDVDEVSRNFPNLYQHLLDSVRPTLEAKRGTSPDNDQYADRWWLFAKTRPAMRKALEGLSRYIATTETAKHRTFQTVSADILPDQKVRVIAVEDLAILAVLSSRLHVTYSDARGNRQGVGNDPVYTHSTCFDPFPFPDLEGKPELKARLDALGERLDSFRKERLEAHDFLTMTRLYNVLERVRALEAGKEGEPPLSDAERDIYEAGLVGVLKDIHDQIDAAVAESYGWPADLEEEEILSRLVALNHERAAEEARGVIRWLRPEFQNPDGRAARVADEQVEMDVGVATPEPSGPRLPEEQGELARSVRALVAASATPLSARDIASRFAGKNTKAKIGRVEGMLSILAAIGQAEATDDGRWFSAG